METVFIVAVLAVLAASLAGNVFQALRYERQVTLFTSPEPPNFFAKEAAEAFVAGKDEAGKDLSLAAVELERIVYNTPQPEPHIDTDQGISP